MMKKHALITSLIALGLLALTPEARAQRPWASAGDSQLALGGSFPSSGFPWQALSPHLPAINSEQLGKNLARRARGLSPQVATLALEASSCAAVSGGAPRARYLAIIDFSQPSTARRFWLFDAVGERLLEQSLVAHGRNSGELFATEFSNTPGSLQSSLGLFYADEPYIGQHGQSLRLQGLEASFNDKAYDRAIVIHGAPYVSDSHISRYHRLGRSLGCPALPLNTAPRAISTLQQGAFLFAYYPDQSYLSSSKLLNCAHRRARA